MFEELWKSLGGSFEKRWLIDVFGPALIFWGGGLWVWVRLLGVKDALNMWRGYAAEEQLFLGAAGLLLVFLTAILLDSFAGALLRVYEGYRPRWPRLARRRADGLRRKLERRRVLRTKVVAGQAAPADRAELAHLDAELAHRPRDPGHSMPTRLGDILHTAEEYARQRYGLDPIVLWPRLYPHLSEPLREALGTAQDQLDRALRLATLAMIHGVTWSIVVVFWRQWATLWWTLPALPLAWLLWRAAHQAAISYAGLFRSAFDLHRFDVYESLGWPRPASPETERARGTELTLYLLEGTGAQGIVYVREEDG